MGMKFSQLQCKEVICISDGRRLGFIADVIVEVPEGTVSAIFVPGPCKNLGLWGRQEDYLIPWRCICRIGPELVLVDIKPGECRIPRSKPGFPWGKEPNG